MTLITAVIAIALIITHAPLWAVTVTTVAALWCLTLDTRAALAR